MSQGVCAVITDQLHHRVKLIRLHKAVFTIFMVDLDQLVAATLPVNKIRNAMRDKTQNAMVLIQKCLDLSSC